MMRHILALLLAVAGLGHAAAAPFPSRPVTIVVPFAAGGTTDILARLIADRMRIALGQAVVVENLSGASGALAVGRVVRAAPDGYTIGIGNWGTHVVNGAVQTLPYDLLDDLAPLAVLPGSPYLVFSNTAVPARDLAGLIAWLKADPDAATCGTGGPGSAIHIAGVFFEQKTGTHLRFVPYRGGTPPAVQDLLAGHIDLLFAQPTDALPQMASGKLRAYAVLADHRIAQAPDIPTVDEAGAPGLYVSTWYGLWLPKGVPQEVVAALSAAVVAALADPVVRVRLADLGLESPPPEQQTPAALGRFHRAEIEKWWPIIKAANIKVD